LIVAVCAIPQAWALWRHSSEMMARYHTVSIFELPWPERLRLMVQGLRFNFGPRFLFVSGSGDLTLHPPGYGQLLAAQSAMLFLALCSLIEPRYRRVAIYLTGWLGIAALTAVSILPFGHPLHALLMLAPITLLCALGMVFLFDLGAASRLARLLMASAILAAVAVQGVKFVRFYFRQYPALAAYQFQYGLGQAVVHAASLGPGPVVISDKTNQPYIYVLFFTRYPPQRFQRERVLQPRGLFAPVLAFDRYRFEDPQLAYLRLKHGVFVFTGWEYAPARPVYSVRSAQGKLAYQIVVK